VNETLARLDGLDARRVLSRGYAVCSDGGTGRIIRSSVAALDARDVRLTFSDGKVSAEVKEKVNGE
jgi:exonuclease VII large subunit